MGREGQLDAPPHLAVAAAGTGPSPAGGQRREADGAEAHRFHRLGAAGGARRPARCCPPPMSTTSRRSLLHVHAAQDAEEDEPRLLGAGHDVDVQAGLVAQAAHEGVAVRRLPCRPPWPR